ncbi:MAG: hypothetical protein IBX57_00205 [Gammaproteobacteria bacterium]|nr:hypothetical protein [Gammaproteobacteria bacterium]
MMQQNNPYFQAPQPQAQARVTKAIFVETGTYNDMASRPYATNINPGAVDYFKEVTQGGSNFSAASIAGAASSFLNPLAQPVGFVGITNGWDISRFRFMLEITIHSNLGPPQRKILQGYTSHAGISNNQHIDPNMMLHFNNVITLRDSVYDTPHGRNIQTTVVESNHLITGNADFGAGNVTHAMRPQDLFCSMTVNQLGFDDIVDTRTTFTDSPIKKSRRSNGSPTHYLSNSLKAYVQSHSAPDLIDSLGGAEVHNTSMGLVQENSVAADTFFQTLIDKTSSFQEGGTITYGEMMYVHPELDHVGIFIPAKAVNKMPTMSGNPMREAHQRGQTENWNTATLETVWAASLSQSIPSIMLDLMITRIGFTATNRTTNGQTDIRIFDSQTFADGLDLKPYIEWFNTRLVHEVINNLVTANNIDYELTALVDVLGETRLTISVAGEHPVDYAAPSFADALFTPVLTQDQQHLRNVAHDLESLATHIRPEVHYDHSDTIL